MKTLTDVYTLSNGVAIPWVGFGTWQTPDGQVAADSVKAALAAGYRHIDTASIYKNETGVGQGIRESGVPREEIFVTTKIWNNKRGYEKTRESVEKSLERLGLDYLDMVLIHWPAAPHRVENWEELNQSTWQALTDLYKEGKIRAIGVSNFKPHHLKALLEAEVKPMVNQIELHPGMTQQETVDLCKEHGILLEAWSPLGCGRLLDHPFLGELAAKYGKSVAQVCIRWCLQKGFLPLPKSVTPSRILDNTKVFDFVLSDEDMAAMDAMENVGWSGLDPDEVDF
ncbi:MAG: aldo/keto reductase [Ruminiclostridium sp.]|nr:aldo/keto reductase [Ruminiclostridium sp.]MBQ5584480.1 aldo/keto reductase [Ruminiclostridium sp.]